MVNIEEFVRLLNRVIDRLGLVGRHAQRRPHDPDSVLWLMEQERKAVVYPCTQPPDIECGDPR